MAGERREAKTMSVELAIQRELAYRKRVAGFLSLEEMANLLPLKDTDDSINRDKASELEKDGWKLVRIDEDGKGSPRPKTNNGQGSMPALEGPKLKRKAENGNLSAVSLPKPDFTRPNTIPSRTIPLADAMRISAPVPKSSPAVPTDHEHQRTSQPGIRVNSARKESISSLNSVPEPTPAIPNVDCDGTQELFCKLCKVECSSPLCYENHLKGKKHRCNLRFKPLLMSKNTGNHTAATRKMRKCELCAVWCSDEDLRCI